MFHPEGIQADLSLLELLSESCEAEGELTAQNENTWKKATFRSASWGTFSLYRDTALSTSTVLIQGGLAKFRVPLSRVSHAQIYVFNIENNIFIFIISAQKWKFAEKIAKNER